MTQWGEWRRGSPDWSDDVDPIQFKKADGTSVTATGGYVDAGFDGEDEYPEPDGFMDESGRGVWFWDFEEWRIAL